MPPACCLCHGRLSCFPCVSGPQGQGLLLFSGGGVLHLPHTWLLSQAEGMLGQRAFRSMRVSSTELRRLAQAIAAASPNQTLMSQGTLCFPRGDAQAKRLSQVGFSHRETGLNQATASRRTFLIECCAFTEALAWSEPHFAAASSARLQSCQGRRLAGELVPLGLCFPGLHIHVLGSLCQAELSRHSHNAAVACAD